MSKPHELPEEASEEPRIRSPEEEAQRAADRLDETIAAERRRDRRDTSAPRDPLRMPGEASSPTRPA